MAEEGGKGLFTKEIEEALLDRRIDLAVHSAKDMPTVLPKGLILAACLEREDPRDVFISRKARSLEELPRGASLGTASLRRQAIAKRARPDLRVMPLRGNVETRLRKLETGEIDALVLAHAHKPEGSVVAIATRQLTDLKRFVTEHGVADMRGKGYDARAKALIAIAPVAHRAFLSAAWADYFKRF